MSCTYYLTFNAHCAFNKNVKYNFHVYEMYEEEKEAEDVENDMLKCIVRRSTKQPCKHKPDQIRRRHIRMHERLNMEIKGTAKDKDNENWVNLHPEAKKGGNFSKAPNVQVIRNIMQDQEKAKKLDPDPFGELHVLQNKQRKNDKTSKKLKGYIRTLITGPNSVTLASEPQIQAYSTLAKNKGLVVFVDATGGIVKNIYAPKGEKPKRPLLYNMQAKTNTGSMTIATLISESHKAEDVKAFFNRVENYSYELTKRILRPQLVSCDFSWPIITGALRQYNDNQDVVDYIKAAYEYQTKKVDIKKKTLVHLCSAHIMHQVSRQIEPKSKEKQFTLGSMSLLLRSQSYEHQKEICTIIGTVLGSEWKTNDVERSLALYQQMVRETPCTENQEKSSFNKYIVEGNENDSDKSTKNTIRDQSPYYKDIVEIFNSIDKNKYKTSDPNPYCNRKLRDYLLDNVIPFMPLITATFLNYYPNLGFSGKEKEMLTNAPVESSFRDIKIRQTQGKKNLEVKNAIPILQWNTGAAAAKFYANKDRIPTQKKWKDKRPRTLDRIRTKFQKEEEKKEEEMCKTENEKSLLHETLESILDFEETWNSKRSKEYSLQLDESQYSIITVADKSGCHLNKELEDEERWSVRKRLTPKTQSQEQHIEQ